MTPQFININIYDPETYKYQLLWPRSLQISTFSDPANNKHQRLWPSRLQISGFYDPVACKYHGLWPSILQTLPIWPISSQISDFITSQLKNISIYHPTAYKLRVYDPLSYKYQFMKQQLTNIMFYEPATYKHQHLWLSS